MSRFRTATVVAAIAALTAAPGCRTAGVGNLSRQDGLPPLPYASAAELLTEHNKNARRITSLEARPKVTVANRRFAGAVDGRLAYERPRNFTMELTSLGNDVARIGSNQDEFWFWFKDDPEKAVMYCNYDESGKSPLAAGLQPDWMVEALGLRVVSEAEASAFKVENGKPGTVVLTERQAVGPNQTLVKETVLDATTHRIAEHRVFSSDLKAKTLLAQATILGYQSVALPGSGGGPGETAETVYLPQRVQLVWSPQERVTLDVTLNGPMVNQPITDEVRQDRFSEPDMGEGYGRQNLATTAGPARANGNAGAGSPPTTIRETLPAPPPRVNLKNPTPLGAAAADRPRGRRPVDEIVSAPIPAGSDTEPEIAAAPARWRTGLDASREQ